MIKSVLSNVAIAVSLPFMLVWALLVYVVEWIDWVLWND